MLVSEVKKVSKAYDRWLQQWVWKWRSGWPILSLNYERPGHPDNSPSLELDSTVTEIFLRSLVDTRSILDSLYKYLWTYHFQIELWTHVLKWKWKWSSQLNNEDHFLFHIFIHGSKYESFHMFTFMSFPPSGILRTHNGLLFSWLN